MTKKEAIYILRNTAFLAPSLEPIDEAIEMACEALKQADIPQMESEIAKAIVHKVIDDAVIAEDAYPDLRQKMHDAVDEYKPQTERSE